MKKKLNIMAVTVATIMVMTPALGLAKELIFGSALPPMHNVNKKGLEPTLKAISKETGGKLNWKLLAGGQLFGLRASLTATGGGLADAGVIIPSFFQSKLPHVYVIVDLSMFAKDGLVANAAAADTIFNDCPNCLKDFKKQKVVPLGFYALTTYKLLCNTKVTNLAEVKGKRIRTSGANGRWARAMGGTPVQMSGSDMIQGLQKGQISCAIGPLGWIKAYKIAEYVTHVLDFPMGNFTSAMHFVMNRRSWDGLTVSQKQMMLNAMPSSSAMASIEGYAKDESIGVNMLKKRNAVFTKGGKEFQVLMDSYLDKDIEAVMSGAKKRGVKNANEIISAYRANVKKWEGILAGKTRDKETVQKLLHKHIYSKIDAAKL